LDEPFLNNYRIKNEYRIWIKEEDKLLALLPLSHIRRLTAAISVIFKKDVPDRQKSQPDLLCLRIHYAVYW